MFIDYVPLMLINMAAGLVILASYISRFSGNQQDRSWASAFFIVGLVAVICGFHMSFNWPLPGSYNVAFGELSVLLGALFLGAGLSVALGWSLLPLGIYALLAGITAIVVGLRIINLKLTQEPVISGVGFIVTGLSGILMPPAIYFYKNRFLRLLVVILLIAGAFIWLRTGYKAYWSHLSNLSKWIPLLMR